MALKISPDVWKKLEEKHSIDVPWEIIECFANRSGIEIDELRQKHKTNPKTKWFISETDHGRKLKVAYIHHPNGDVEIKSAFEPNDEEIAIYRKHGYRQP